MNKPIQVEYDYVSLDDLPAALEIENAAYPPDEAATEESFRLRQSQAGDLFLGAYRKDDSGSRKLVGYVCSTLSPAESLTHESMLTHVPDSSSVCIHSVCVSPPHQRQGIGLNLISEYIARLEGRRKDHLKADRLLLITHDNLRGLYEKAGFIWLGKSNVVHGSKPWFEMRKDLVTPSESESLRNEKETPEQMIEGTQQIPPGVIEALRRPRTNIPSSRLISDFPHALSDLIEPDDEKPGISVNRFDLLCPRLDCGSIILKKGVATWVERASIQLEPAGTPSNSYLPPLPTPPETAQWWLVTPTPMAFENIGFTRPIEPLTEYGHKLKLLICAECDLGPVGWSEVGGSEFWLACSRVAYRG